MEMKDWRMSSEFCAISIVESLSEPSAVVQGPVQDGDVPRPKTFGLVVQPAHP